MWKLDPFASYSSTVTKIHGDSEAWKTTKQEFEQNKVEQQRIKWLASAADETTFHVKSLGKFALKGDANQELEAIKELRALQGNLQQTHYWLREKLQNGSDKAMSSALGNINKTLSQIDTLLIALGKRKHQREYGASNPEVAALDKKVQSMLMEKGFALESPTIFPESPQQLYQTMVADSTTKALPFVTELALGYEHDTREVLIETSTGAIAVPRVFAQDVGRGNYSLNGKLLRKPGDPPEKSMATFRSYCQAVGGTQQGYVLCSLLVQNSLVPLNKNARDILDKQELKAAGRATYFDVTVTQNDVVITVKIAMDGKSLEDESLVNALLLKRVITIPRQQFEETALTIEQQRPQLELWDQNEKTHEEADAYRQKTAASPILFGDATVVDSISTFIATGELAAYLLPSF